MTTITHPHPGTGPGPASAPVAPSTPWFSRSDLVPFSSSFSALNSPSSSESALKIRIPRDLANLPDVFRKRGAIRSSQPSSEPTPDGLVPILHKRSYADMTHGNPRSFDSEHRFKRRLPPSLAIPPHLAGARNLAIRTSPKPISAHPSPPREYYTKDAKDEKSDKNKAASQPMSAPTALPRHRPQKTKSVTPSRTASFASSTAGADQPLASEATGADPKAPTIVIPVHSHGTRSAEGTVQVSATSAAAAAVDGQSQQSGSSLASSLSAEQDGNPLKPIEIVRVGMAILDQLACNTFCRSFINKVPLSVTNYYVVIKKPMDLTTIEQRLWNTFQESTSSTTSTISPEEKYSTLQDFEKDLRRIFQNATYFNTPTHVIYKEALAYQTHYLGLLAGYRQGKLPLNIPIPHESFRPELISLSEPGPLYIFRAHTVREMDRKMTDISVDLFSTLHQPLFDTAAETGQLSPENPRFLRMYINKNRSVLAKCRDERHARIAILTDLQVGKPFSDQVKASPGRTKAGAPVSMVRITAKVLIGKPIGQRHDMITVGDLDCPNAWITVACVRALELDMDVPSKFEKGTLSKMRHEVVPYSADTKMNPEHQRAFAEALGLSLSTMAKRGTAYETTVKRSPGAPSLHQKTASNASAGLGITTSTPSTPSTPKKTKGQRGRGSVVSIQDQGAGKRFLVTLRLPILKSSLPQPNAIRTPTSVTCSPSQPSASTLPAPRSLPATPYLQSAATLEAAMRPIVFPPLMTNLTLSSQCTPTLLVESEPLPDVDRKVNEGRLTQRGQQMLHDLKLAAQEQHVPYTRWNMIEPTLTVDSAHGLFKRIYHVRGQEGLVVQNFKEMDSESFEQRVREVACLLKLRGLDGVGQIQSVIDNEDDHLVGLSMTKYAYTLKAYATNARRHPSPCQKLSLVRDMIAAMSAIHGAGLAHRDLSEVNIMVDEDPTERLEDNTPRPLVKVIDFGKSVFVEPEEVKRWTMQEKISDEELELLPFVVLPPDHGYKLYRSILTLPRTKHDHSPMPPVDPRSEDVYSLGVLIWRTFSGKSPWNGAIEDDLKTIRYMVSSDSQIKFQLEREVVGPVSRELLLRCLTAEARTRWTAQELHEWLNQPEVSNELLKEFEALGGGRKKVRKNLD